MVSPKKPRSKSIKIFLPPIVILAFLLLYLLSALNSLASQWEQDFYNKIITEPLRGIKSIAVLQGQTDDGYKQLGLNRAEIISHVIRKLRIARVKVLPLSKYGPQPVMIVTIDRSKVNIRIIEQAILERDHSISFTATTWETSEDIKFSNNHFSERMLNAVNKCIDLFVEHYLIANPNK